MNDDINDYYENTIPDPETQEIMNEEIQRAPRSPEDLRERMKASRMTPETSGGDLDADWEEADDDGAESFGGHVPTPDQSNVEENAEAMGFNYEDNQELDILEKIGKRDRDRFELDEDSKGEGDMI